MASIARVQANTPDILRKIVYALGVPADAFAIGFRILDMTSGLPGTQVFPVADGTYEAVTTGAGKTGTGAYYAYDVAILSGWKPDIDEPLGLHRIQWRWQTASGGPYFYSTEDFAVTDAAASAPLLYCSVEDLRKEGVTVAHASDEALLAAIITWQQAIDRITRQWFVPRALTLNLDGTDSDVLHFPVPIISVESMNINSQPDALEVGLYRVYNNRTEFQDDRRNPRIQLIGDYQDQNFFSRPIVAGSARMKFLKGRQNQNVVGVFGYVEADGSTPLLIKRALVKLVAEKIARPIVSSGAAIPPIVSGVVLEEETDNHRIRYAEPGGGTAPGKNSISGLTSDPEVRDILRFYKAPLAMATPAHWSV